MAMRRQRDQGIERPGGRHLVERVLGGGGAAQQQRSLPEVVEQQRRKDHREPGGPDRPAPEVAHVRIERLASGDHQDHAAEHEQPAPAVAREERHPVQRVRRPQHGGVGRDLHDAEDRENGEPGEHHRSEHGADARRPVALKPEERDQDRDGGRHDHRLEPRGRHTEPLDGAQHGDGRRDHPVAVQERRAEQPEPEQRRVDRVRRAPPPDDEREQRQDPALAFVVGAHHEDDVLH